MDLIGQLVIEHTQHLQTILGASLNHPNSLPAEGIDWKTLTFQAGQQMVLPSVYRQLRQFFSSTDVPVDVFDFLQLVYKKNQERNARMLICFEEAVHNLNQIGIVPTELKGCGLLANSSYGQQIRMTLDIDLLINPAELMPALRAFKEAGYLQLENTHLSNNYTNAFNLIPIDLDDFRNSVEYTGYHAPMIIGRDQEFGIELHVKATPGSDSAAVFLNEYVKNECSTNATNEYQTNTTSESFDFLFNVYHSQIKDRCNRLGQIDWRHLIDAQQLLRHTLNDNLLQEVFARAEYNKMDVECYTFLAQIQQLLGVNIELDSFRTPAREGNADKFFKLLEKPQTRKYLRFTDLWKVRLQYFTPTELSMIYGPIPFSVAFFRLIHFRLRRAIFFMRSTKTSMREVSTSLHK